MPFISKDKLAGLRRKEVEHFTQELQIIRLKAENERLTFQHTRDVQSQFRLHHGTPAGGEFAVNVLNALEQVIKVFGLEEQYPADLSEGPQSASRRLRNDLGTAVSRMEEDERINRIQAAREAAATTKENI